MMMLCRRLIILAMAFVPAIFVAPPGIPEITAPSKIILGDRVTMYCNVTGGDPTPSVIWYRDNIPIDNTSTTIGGVTVNSLTFTATHDEHLEVFECQTDNRITQNPLSKTKFVEVYATPQPPTITGPTTLQSQSTGTWRCTSILGYPAPSMTMRIGNNAFNNQANYRVSYDATSQSYTVTGTLVWSPTSANNGQTIFCDVYHPDTSRTNTPQTVGLTLSISSPFGIFAPGTLYKPMVGDTVVLNCIITSGSATQIQWFVNGERIIISSRPRFGGSSVNNPSLTISQVQESDRGSYICQGSDGSNTMNTSAISLEPRAPLAVSAPLTQYTAIMDESVALTCVITSGTATQIRWFKDNVPVDITNNVRLNGGLVANPTLTISNTQQSDAGVYVCEAFDGVTRSTTTGITLTVTEKVVIIDDVMLSFMDKYNKLSRPATNDVPIVHLTHYLDIIRIEELDDDKLVLYAWQGLSWNDPRLQWTGEPKRLSLPSSAVWTPDIVPLNEHDDKNSRSQSCTQRILWTHKDVTLENVPFSLDRHIIRQCSFGKAHKRELKKNKLTGIIKMLYNIMNCTDETCDDADHYRHHEFIREPLEVYNRERLTHNFGGDIFESKTIEKIAMSLMDELLFNRYKDPKHPYSEGKITDIKKLSNTQLKGIFMKHGLNIGDDADPKVIVTRDGNVSWFLRGNVTSTRCSMKAGAVIECIFNFQLWTYDKDMVDLYLRSNGVLTPVELGHYEQHPGYEIVSTCAVRKENVNQCCAQTYHYLQYTVVLKEKTKVYPDNATCTAK